jgi:hypothetical protein
MERTVVWFADDCGFTVHVRYGSWVVDRFSVDTMTAPVDGVRMQAVAWANDKGGITKGTGINSANGNYKGDGNQFGK